MTQTQTIKATASAVYELLQSRKMGATLYYDSQDDELVVSSNVPSAWHEHYTEILTRDAAISWMGDDFQDADEPTDFDCEQMAIWINEEILPDAKLRGC
jgi:hypothetical protein